MISDSDRETMCKLWADRHENELPSLQAEGSKTFLGLIQTHLSKNCWGLFSNSKAVCRATEHVQEGTRPSRISEGYYKDEFVERELSEAHTKVELLDRVEVIIATTMIVIFASPETEASKIREVDLRQPFKYLFVADALGLYPWMPSSQMSALRNNMLAKITDLQITKHKSLKEALSLVCEDSNFWFLNLHKSAVEQSQRSNSNRQSYVRS